MVFLGLHFEQHQGMEDEGWLLSKKTFVNFSMHLPGDLALKIGAWAMTTTFLDNAICTFKILLSCRFAGKTISSPPPIPPLKTANFVFIVVTPSLRKWRGFWWRVFSGVRFPVPEYQNPYFCGHFRNRLFANFNVLFYTIGPKPTKGTLPPYSIQKCPEPNKNVVFGGGA